MKHLNCRISVENCFPKILVAFDLKKTSQIFVDDDDFDKTKSARYIFLLSIVIDV